MIPLFSAEGLLRLRDMTRPGLLCAFDFDGTLAPIVADPTRAVLPDDIRERLVELSGCTAVAIITGRSLEDIRPRLGFEPDFIVGNHGIEGLPDWERSASVYRNICDDWHARLAAMLGGDPAAVGVEIEDKRYSLSVHYRRAADYGKAEEMLERLFEKLEPSPRVITGKCLFNLVPADAADKGAAMIELLNISGATSAIYVGDDVTDEDVFRMKRSDVLSIRVEPAADSAADFFLPQHEDIAQLLDELVTQLCRAGAQNWTRMDQE